MENLEKMYEEGGISRQVYDFGEKILKDLKERFEGFERMAEYNQLKIMSALRQCKVSEACFAPTTGYGYNDLGRDTLEEVYAKVFNTEAALVRPQITCGTHAIATAISAQLRPGDELLSVSGKPYDTLEEIIGIRPGKGSLKEYGISYSQVDLTPSGAFDKEKIKTAIKPDTKLIAIQRSKGYQTRPSLSVEAIGDVISFIKSIRSDIIVFVDNCYGEFVEKYEPTDVGADIIAGSLIKNPGGGLAPCGGYIAGKADLIENAAFRLTCPGLGKEVGASLNVNRSFYQGLFMAPTVVCSSLKAAVFAAAIYERLGFDVIPSSDSRRADIIQAVTLGSKERVITFCNGIQSASPVDAHVTCEPWDMPGYDCQVIMAAGAFISGSSIELSADAPIKEPYAVYFQGGLTWPHAKYGILSSLQKLVDENLTDIYRPA